MSSTETRPELRDCPFCHTKGSDDEKVFFTENVTIFNGGSYTASYTIFCSGCGVELHDEYRDDLVDRWNGVVAKVDDEDGSPEEMFPLGIIPHAKGSAA